MTSQITNLITQEKSLYVNNESLTDNIVNQIIYNQKCTSLLLNEDYRNVIKDKYQIIESVSTITNRKFAYCLINYFKMTISEIKQKSLATSPYFFTSKSMKFFGQTMRSFKVHKQSDGRYKISAPMKDRFTGKLMGETVRFFNPSNNELEHS